LKTVAAKRKPTIARKGAPVTAKNTGTAAAAGLLKPGATLRILTNRKLKRISLPGAAAAG